MKKISIITTTINIPIFLNNIIKNIQSNKSQQNFDISIIVIGDKKTPLKTKSFVKIYKENLK